MNMQRSLAVGITTLLLISTSVQAAPALGDDVRVFVIGDQLAVELAGRDAFIDAVQSAGGSVHGLGRAGREATTLDPPPELDSNDVVLVCVGMIDSLRGDAHLERFEIELQAAIQSIASDRIVLLTPVPREIEAEDERIAAANHAVVVGRYADAVGRVANGHGCMLVDLHDPLTLARSEATNGSLLRNGMHLDGDGWSLAEAEVLWQLDWSEVEPGGFESTSDVAEDIGSAHELELLRGTHALPALSTTDSGLPTIEKPVVPNWEEAASMLAGMDDRTDIETVRDTMRLLTTTSDRSEETLGLLQSWMADDRPADVRLAAMAAIDDLAPGSSGMQTIRIGVVPVKMTYDPARFEVEAGRPVRLMLSNTDGQPHNLLVCAPGSLRAIGRASEAMGTTAEAKARDWVPDSPKVLHVMPMIQLGGEGELRFMAPERPGRYPIICTYPGHWRMMNGVMTVRRPSE